MVDVIVVVIDELLGGVHAVLGVGVEVAGGGVGGGGRGLQLAGLDVLRLGLDPGAGPSGAGPG